MLTNDPESNRAAALRQFVREHREALDHPDSVAARQEIRDYLDQLMLPVPGEPLVFHQRRLKPPGASYRDPVWHTTRQMLQIALCGLLAWLVWSWVTADPTPRCVTLDDYESSRIDYQGWNNAWTLDGRIVGYSETEDSCIHPASA